MRKQRAERLRFAVNSLPPETQRAMLDGINENRIVTGANTDRRGGKCPMIAADPHAFEVTPLAEIFATAWDKYTGTSFVNVTRRTACERDLSVLRSMLETSLALHPSTASHAVVEVREVAELPVAPRAEFTDASRALTVSARLEVIRALAATEHTAMPQARTLPAPQPATAWVDEPQPARRTVAAPRRKAARVAPAVARTAAPAGRTPTYKTKDELDRQRAREIIANQASTLRSRAWPRARDAQPVAAATPPAAAVPTPAAVTPAPVAAPTPTPAQVDRVQELVAKSGFAWLRPLRSYDEYEQTLTDLGETHRARAGDDGGVHRDDTKRPEPSRA